MKRPSRFPNGWFWVLLLALTHAGPGCRHSPPDSSTVPPTFTAPPPESSVRPGINAELLKPDLNPSQWVERFEKEGREIYDRRADIAEAVRLKPGQVIADIGAGTGLFTPMFSAAVGPQGKVYAVDIVKEFLRLIEERSAKAGLKNVQTVLSTDRSVELPPNSVDVAFVCDTYHHFEYPLSTLRSLHRAMRDGGELVLIDFKRIPDQSSEWVMNHVRAGQEVVTSEVVSAGFTKVEELPLLKENYFVRFKKNNPR